MSFPAYDDYKDSGVDWFAELPDHWSMPPLYARYEQVLGKMLDLNKMTGVHPVPYVRNVDVQWDQVNAEALPLIDIEPSERERFTLNQGDLLICEGGEVGRTAIWNGECGTVAFQKAIHRLRPIDGTEHVRYFYYVMRFATSMQVFLASSNPNTIPHLTGEQLRRYRLPKPMLDEQEAISSFLDVETSKIDGLVSEQRRLIELLKEKRQAVISHAVTKGLNPNAPMKPSGIQWLGDVPQHWEVMTVKRGITKIGQGFSPQCHSEPASDEEWGVVKVGCCNKFDLNETEQKRLPPELDPVIDYEIQNGDILMSRGNTLDLVGMASLVRDVRSRLLLCDLIYRFRAQHDVFDPAFLVHSLRSKNVRSQIECNAVGSSSTMKKVSQELVRNLLVCRPPLKEQQEISNLLATMSGEFDRLESEAERAIELFLERRTALISAAVTGKIDVRSFVEKEAVA